MKKKNTAPAFNLLKILTLGDVNGMVSLKAGTRIRQKLSVLIEERFHPHVETDEMSGGDDRQEKKASKEEVPEEGEKIERIVEKEHEALKDDDLLNKMGNYLSGEEEEGAIERNSSTDEIDRNVFILDAQRRLKSVRKKMRVKDIYKSYQKSSNVEIHHHEQTGEEDITESSTSGVLVNKKHY